VFLLRKVSGTTVRQKEFFPSLFTHLAVYFQLFILIRLSYPYTVLPTYLGSFEPEVMK